MWRSKKFIVITLLVAVVLVGGISGIVLASDTRDECNHQSRTTLLERVAEKLGIDKQELTDAFAEARSELRAENPEGWQRRAPMAGVAETLGVEPQALQDAFAQARSEMRDGTLDSCGHEALMARVAEILGIDQQALEDTCVQTREARGEMHPDGERPFKHCGRGHFGSYHHGEHAPQNS